MEVIVSDSENIKTYEKQVNKAEQNYKQTTAVIIDNPTTEVPRKTTYANKVKTIEANINKLQKEITNNNNNINAEVQQTNKNDNHFTTVTTKNKKRNK